MKISALIFLIFSWGVIILLNIFCFYNLIKVHAKNIKPQLEIERELKEKGI
jgi:uncharacterized membrane protein YdbT with pleckstrin-like domain